jgi:N-acetylneuraminate lyase
MKKPFSGVWPAMLTPLTETGQVEHGELEKLVELLVRQGLGGLYILGSTGQWPLLSLEQRQAVAERVVKTAAGRVPIIVHVGAVATDDAVALARHAARIGADGVSAVTPIYYPAGPDVVFEHYRRIGAASDLPLFVYHLSIVNQMTLGPRDYVDRVLTLPHIAGMKVTDHDLFQLALMHAHAGDRLLLFSGADELMCHAALCGVVGAIGSFYNLWGPACMAARQAFVDGSFEAGRRFMLGFQTALGEILGKQSAWTFLRAAMRMKHDIDIGPTRAPLGIVDKPWNAADVERLIAQVEESAPGGA